MFFKLFKTDVKTPAKTITTPCPIANRNNIVPASVKFPLSDAKLIIPASIGVEQGVDASANIAPISIGYKTSAF